MDLKKHILAEVDKLFSRYGIKSVTMDDIAKHLGISKKTLYLHFSDKNELVMTLTESKIESQTYIINQGYDQVENAVQELFVAVNNLEEILADTNPILFFDLQKYHPQAWGLFKNFRENSVYEKMLNNLSRGIKEGYYRHEINLEIIARMRIEQIDMAFNQNVFSTQKYSMSQVMRELTIHFLYGICTPEGQKLISDFRNTSYLPIPKAS